jgi:hypothetical protein
MEEPIERKMLGARQMRRIRAVRMIQGDSDSGGDGGSTDAGVMQLDIPPAVRHTRPVTQPKYPTWEPLEGPVTDCDCDY